MNNETPEQRIERIAIVAMQAIIAKLPPQSTEYHNNDVEDAVGAGAVSYAKALIRELDA